MSDLLHFACEYARAGMAVFPCKLDKTPYTAHGFQEASTDEEVIKAWWTKWPDANIAIATGRRSGGIFVIDQDEKNGQHGIHEFESWRDKNGLYWPKTWEVSTPSGGKHTYFKASVNISGRVGWLPGVDIRGDGGYVLAPPSRGSGGAYEWICGPYDIFDPVSDDDTDVGFIVDEINTPHATSESFTAPAEVIEGGRNDTLYKMACSLQAKGLSDSAILAAVQAENAAKCRPPLGDDEIQKLVRSALTKQKGPADQKQEEPSVKSSKYDFPLRQLYSAKDLMSSDDKELVVYVGDESTPLLSEGTTVLAAPPKLGKSWFCLNLALALPVGADFLGFKTHKCHVQYYDLEQSRRLKKKRIRRALETMQTTTPDGFYLADELQSIGRGLVEQIEYDVQQDPQIGVVIIDVFTYVEIARKNTETEYQWTYKNFNVINRLAAEHHLAIILVLHTRKAHDPDHPFDNILGSTANQGASSHMIVLAKSKYNSKTVHLYAQGRETEGIIELDYENNGGVLSLVDVQNDAPDDLSEFMESEIRNSIKTFMETTSKWKGRCSGLIEEMARQGIGLDASPIDIGRFLSKNVGRLQKHDDLTVTIIKNGTAPKIYQIEKSVYEETTIDTIDEWHTTIDANPFNTA